MNDDLISRSALRKKVNSFFDSQFEGIVSSDLIKYAEAVDELIDNAPTVVPKEMKPLIDKVVEIIPQLTDAIVEQLPEVVENSLDICYDCEYRRKARGDV